MDFNYLSVPEKYAKCIKHNRLNIIIKYNFLIVSYIRTKYSNGTIFRRIFFNVPIE